MIFGEDRNIDLADLTPVKGMRMEVTDPTGNPRITIRKTTTLCHKPRGHTYCLAVKLEKVIDGETARSYGWIEELTKTETEEFIHLVKENKKGSPYSFVKKGPYPHLTPEEIRERKRIRALEYYHKNKEKIREKKRENHREAEKRRYEKMTPEQKEEMLQKKRKYYQEHKEKWNTYYQNRLNKNK